MVERPPRNHSGGAEPEVSPWFLELLVGVSALFTGQPELRRRMADLLRKARRP